MPYTATVLYCDPNDIVARYDERKVRAYLVDDDFTDPDTLVLEDSTILLAAIHDATAYINMKIQRSKRYSIQDIRNYILLDPDTGNPRFPEVRAQVVRLCVDLAVGNLMRRRMLSEEAIKGFVPSLENTMETLAALQDGKMVFDISSAIDAGVPEAAGQISGAPTYQPDFTRPTIWNPMYGRFGGVQWR